MTLKGDEQVVLVIVLFLGGFFVGVSVEGNDLPLKEILAGVVTLVAAYAGANYAFRLQNKKLELQKTEQNVAAANRAIYTLFEMWNLLRQYQKEVIDPVRDKAGQWIQMTPTIPGIHESIIFKADSLDFLLGSGSPEVYADLFLEEKRYRIAVTLITERSKLVLTELYPRMEQLGIPKGGKVDLAALEQNLGPDLSSKLQSLTKSIINNVDEDVVSLKAQYDKLQSLLSKLMPHQKFIKVMFEEKPIDAKNVAT